ncbi:lysosomal cobalamin transporter [Acrasis kona]|uniref:Lysosomal cobalamin transporter n=1 Tax=Acrasis kona TaxID=1008807 RepID=A0AAW2YIS6_9EUKA
MEFKYPPWIPYVILSGVVVFTISMSFVVTWLFKSFRHKAKLPLFVSALGVSAILFSVSVIPVDIFMISQTEDPSTHGQAIRIVYYSSYLTLFVFAFTLIPFAYFYYEEGSDEYSSIRWRIINAFKFTVLSLVCGIILVAIVLGLAIGFPNQPSDAVEWLKELSRDKTIGDRIVSGLVSVIAIVGLPAWWLYTGYGLAALPVSLIKGKKKLRLELGSIAEEMVFVSGKISSIKGKYALTGTKMNKADQKEYDQLKEKLKLLRNRDLLLEKFNSSWYAKCYPFLYPFKVIFGLILLLVSLALVVSLIITLIDRVIHSTCGIKCGFIIDKSYIFNPFDELLTVSSKVFPIDYIIFGVFLSFILIVSLVGLANIGLRFFFVKLYKLKYKRTAPQGLLTTCIFLMFIVVVFSFTMNSFAPKYTTFGTQTYHVNGEVIGCDFNGVQAVNETKPVPVNGTHTLFYGTVLQEAHNETQRNVTGRPCYMSQLSMLMNGSSFNGYQIYTLIFYFGNWVFVVVFCLSLLIASVRKPASFLPDEDEDEDSDDESLESLTGSEMSNRRYGTKYEL